MLQRSIIHFLLDILGSYKKMAFLSGPRQVGKTTLAEMLRTQFAQSVNFNWDVISEQKRFLKDPFFFTQTDRVDNSPDRVSFFTCTNFFRQFRIPGGSLFLRRAIIAPLNLAPLGGTPALLGGLHF